MYKQNICGITREERLPNTDYGPHDMRCPQIPGTAHNYWQAQCLKRQRINPECARCLIGRTLRAEKGLPPVEVKAKKRPVTLCACGETATPGQAECSECRRQQRKKEADHQRYLSRLARSEQARRERAVKRTAELQAQMLALQAELAALGEQHGPV